MERDIYRAVGAFFKEQAIPYRELKHAPGAATEEYHQAVGCRYEQQAKCLFLKVIGENGTYHAICTIQAQKKADFKALKRMLNAKDVKFATKEELKDITGCEFGELPPVGKLFGVPLLMDSDFLTEDEIFLNAGRVDVSFAINPHDLKRIEQPVMF